MAQSVSLFYQSGFLRLGRTAACDPDADQHRHQLHRRLAGRQVPKRREEEKAVSARVRILSFMNSLLENHKPTKDAFDQTMSDITRYEHFCDSHPTFKNNQTASTVTYLEKNYQERLEKHDFL